MRMSEQSRALNLQFVVLVYHVIVQTCVVCLWSTKRVSLARLAAVGDGPLPCKLSTVKAPGQLTM